MFSFLTAKIYIRMIGLNDKDPILRTIVYITILHLFLSMSIYIPLQTLLFIYLAVVL